MKYKRYPHLFPDIDECTTETDACVDAACTNTVGGYTCACNTGYEFMAGSQHICMGR